ncbi:LOW QUALITY PROTEIN: intraflagellar transport-associated protein-like [Dromiciops gliroides]|uniref:LOW QUALITY PROTEIN: intraflagellar transport-associated protein-like n=1 Tax=Dromiciops gliroides TaxID=33562 RepID=UPI001CC38513|nr:LOW QUALITY PROTEIN: intraflagellar transport-associated protein-like [Dromiciops gliroides]
MSKKPEKIGWGQVTSMFKSQIVAFVIDHSSNRKLLKLMEYGNHMGDYGVFKRTGTSIVRAAKPFFKWFSTFGVHLIHPTLTYGSKELTKKEEEATQVDISVRLLRLGIVDEDQLIEQALDRFINCNEQTYEEFLNTFTHLSKYHEVTKSQTPETEASGNIFATLVFPCGQNIRNEYLSLHPIPQPQEEEEIVIDEDQKIVISIQGNLNQKKKVKVDNFLDLEDFDTDEETDHKLNPELLLLLPGKVEEDLCSSLSGCIPSLEHHSHLKPKTWSKEQPEFRHLKEIPVDEVQIFLLDKEFDYDSVMLTPKFCNSAKED